LDASKCSPVATRPSYRLPSNSVAKPKSTEAMPHVTSDARESYGRMERIRAAPTDTDRIGPLLTSPKTQRFAPRYVPFIGSTPDADSLSLWKMLTDTSGTQIGMMVFVAPDISRARRKSTNASAYVRKVAADNGDSSYRTCVHGMTVAGSTGGCVFVPNYRVSYENEAARVPRSSRVN
jgi:hypothetical protein